MYSLVTWHKMKRKPLFLGRVLDKYIYLFPYLDASQVRIFIIVAYLALYGVFLNISVARLILLERNISAHSAVN